MNKKSKEFWTRANRKTVVCRTEIVEIVEGSILRPRVEHLTEAGNPEVRAAIVAGEPIWALMITSQEGLDEEKTSWILHSSKQEAEAISEGYQPGDEMDPHDFLRVKTSDFDAENLSFYTNTSVSGRGEAPYGMLFEALQGAGVLCRDNRLSSDVLLWVGEDGQRKLKQKFGESWASVAALEFCVVHFHETSLATLAARVQVADFVSETDYDAGYASREFEMLYSGAEHLALQAKSARHLAGVEGGKASRNRRLANLETLMQEIERLSKAVGLISEDRIVSQAIEAALDREPVMPKSKKTLDDYETALRSEEPFRSRYRAVFHKNA